MSGTRNPPRHRASPVAPGFISRSVAPLAPHRHSRAQTRESTPPRGETSHNGVRPPPRHPPIPPMPLSPYHPARRLRHARAALRHSRAQTRESTPPRGETSHYGVRPPPRHPPIPPMPLPPYHACPDASKNPRDPARWRGATQARFTSKCRKMSQNVALFRPPLVNPLHLRVENLTIWAHCRPFWPISVTLCVWRSLDVRRRPLCRRPPTARAADDGAPPSAMLGLPRADRAAHQRLHPGAPADARRDGVDGACAVGGALGARPRRPPVCERRLADGRDAALGRGPGYAGRRQRNALHGQGARSAQRLRAVPRRGRLRRHPLPLAHTRGLLRPLRPYAHHHELPLHRAGRARLLPPRRAGPVSGVR